jgi:hypothetical protein
MTPDEPALAFTCTGRGTHDPAVPENVAVSFPAVPGRHGGNVGTDLRCPVCGLARRIGYRARRKLAAAGLAEVDISRLPF